MNENYHKDVRFSRGGPGDDGGDGVDVGAGRCESSVAAVDDKDDSLPDVKAVDPVKEHAGSSAKV